MIRLLPLLCISAPAFAGINVVWERVKGGEAPSTLSLKCEGPNARFDGAGGPLGGHTVIWDSPKKTLNILKLKEKTYTQLTEQQVAEVKEKGRQIIDAMRAKAAAMPPEQRAQFEAMLSQSGMGEEKPAEWSFKATGKKSKVGKWDCELYEGTRGDFKTDFCIAPWATSPLKKEDLECVRSVSQMFSSITRGMARDGDSVHEDLTKFPGMPLQTIRINPDGKKFVSSIKSVERVKLPPTDFTVPADFKLHAKEEMIGGAQVVE